MFSKNIFKSNKFKDKFIFKQNGNIWRFYFNNDFIIAGETRNLESKEFTLYSLNYKSKEIYFKDLSPKVGWWCNICGMNDKHFYMSRYKKPDLPIEKGIIALDLKNGSVLWENEDLKFFFNDDDNVYGIKELFETKKIYKLDCISGDVIEEISGLDGIQYLEREKMILSDLLYKDCKYTENLSIDLETKQKSFKKHIDNIIFKNKIIGNFEYSEYDNLILYNYHFQKGINIKDRSSVILGNILEIYDKSDEKVVYKDVINESVPAPAPDSFFIKGNYLIYVKNKNELIIINLENK